MTLPATELLDAALGAEDPADRRRAFVAIAASDDWRLVLAPHVISRQGRLARGRYFPDWLTFRETAAAISDHPDRVDHVLSLAGTRFADELLFALAAEMGPELVTPALARLRGAAGPQADLLVQVLQAADPGWLARREADAAVTEQLSSGHGPRARLMRWLAAAGALERHVDALREHPPVTLDEWGALGRANLADPVLVSQAMAVLPYEPSPLVFLMRLAPRPPQVLARVMASARPTWASAALEAAVLSALHSLELTPLAEIALRAGGRPQAIAGAWINSAGLGRHVLGEYLRQLDQGGDVETTRRIGRTISADRVLARARRGQEVDPMDAAALARQARGDQARALVREILEMPREALVEPVLHHLCAVCGEAAVEVERLATEGEPAVAARARACLRWEDVVWPDEGAVTPTEPDPPADMSAAGASSS